MTFFRCLICILIALFITACGGDDRDDFFLPPIATDDSVLPPGPGPGNNVQVANEDLDTELQLLIVANNLHANPDANRNLPDISDPLPQLGMKLFFSKSLGGEFEAACVSCHHPLLGGGDELSLPVGTNANNEDLLGAGRQHTSGLPILGRNSPTIFNSGLNDTGMFWDSRVESIGKEPGSNGSQSGIRTPDTGFGIADTNAGENLPSAQSRFPVTAADEMLGDFEQGSENNVIRNHLAARIGNYGNGIGELAANNWLAEFQAAYGSTDLAPELINFANIANAIGEYERSIVLINSPWNEYLAGDETVLSNAAKRGAILFLTPADEGGVGCVACHSGSTFTDGLNHIVAFPQIGPGKGDGNNDDFGRERETGDENDRYHFRTPSLLNVELTAPYGHSGSYATLSQAVDHYANPRAEVNDYFLEGGWCQLAQFNNLDNCSALYPEARRNSMLAVDKLEQKRNAGTALFVDIDFSQQERADVVSFLESLTDPCALDRNCLDVWIPTAEDALDENQLNARNAEGILL